MDMNYRSVLIIVLAMAAAAMTGCSRPKAISNGIVLRGHGEIKALPDVAELSLSVISRDRSNNGPKALADNAKRCDAVRSAIVKLGFPSRDITTESFEAGTVQPYEYDRTYRPKGKPYFEVRNTLLVTTKDITKVGEIIDTALKAGATAIGSVNYMFSNPARLQARTLALAVEDAKVRADAVARAGGVRLLPVSRVVQAGLEERSPSPEERAPCSVVRVTVPRIAPHTFAAPREEAITADVTVTFAIERR